MRRVALEPGVRDPADLGALLQVLRERERVLGVALRAQRQGLGAEQQLLGGKGVEVRAEVADNLDAGADDEGDGAKRLPELEAVVPLGGLDELREARGVGAPVELAAVDDDAADGGAVAADPLGRRVHDDVGAVLDGPQEVAARAESVVDDEGHTLGVGDLGDGLEVGDVVARVADALDVDGLGLVVDQGGDLVWVVAVDEFSLDAEARQEDFELVVRATVEVGCGDDVVAGVGEGVDGDELRALAGGGSESSDTTFEGSDTLLEYVDSGLWRCLACLYAFCPKFASLARRTFIIRL